MPFERNPKTKLQLIKTNSPDQQLNAFPKKPVYVVDAEIKQASTHSFQKDTDPQKCFPRLFHHSQVCSCPKHATLSLFLSENDYNRLRCVFVEKNHSIVKPTQTD